VRGADQKRLYVSSPRAGMVTVIDAEAFTVVKHIPAGKEPLRTALQPDGRYLWVGNDARTAPESGVTVIDVQTQKVVKKIATGRGHHEIAFSADDRWAFVTNREEGTVSVIDVRKLRKEKDLRTGPLPIAVAFSPLSAAAYVADGKDGSVSVVDGSSLEVAARVQAKPGLGPLRFTQDGRWGFVVNTAENAVHVIDAAENKLAHTIPVPGKPYQVVFTRAFAYLRLLDSETVNMVNLLSLGEGKTPIVNTFSAGTGAPRNAGDLSLADSITPASTDAAVFVNNPADGKTYFYMEGMNAPMGSFSNYGHKTTAAGVVDRSVKEVSPGIYVASLRLPEAGRYDVAFLLDTPKVLHCFTTEVKPNPLLASAPGAIHAEYLDLPQTAEPGRPVKLRVKLSNPRGGAPHAGLRDVQVSWYKAPASLRRAVIAREAGAGIYEADLAFSEPGAWYVQVTVPSLKAGPGEVPYRSLVVRKPAAAAGR
jgi:YVTN family beta-propeller protein